MAGFLEEPQAAPVVAADKPGVAPDFARDSPIVALSEGGGAPGSYCRKHPPLSPGHFPDPA